MTTQVPPGPENAVAPHEYPQFAMGYAQYPPPPKPEYQPVSAPPATYLAEGYPVGAYPAVSYPQEGAPGYPEPVPYPQPSIDHAAATHPQPSAYPPAGGHPQSGPHPSAGDHPQLGPYPPAAAEPQPGAYPPADGHPQPGGYPPAAAHPQPGAYPPAGRHPQASAYPPAAAHPQPGAYPPAAAQPQPGAYPQASGQAGGYPQAQPGAYPPPAAYPTAPPWAAEHQPPATDPAAAPEQPLPPQYGGLLVPFPDKMQHASRAQPPAVWPVAVFTLLFSILGIASAKRRADQARRTRNSSAPYWIAFLVSGAAGAFIWFVLGAVVVGPLLGEMRENNRIEAVQRNVVGDGQLEDARIAVTAAQCRAVTDRDAAGMRDYLCRLTLEDGHTASLTLTADVDGQWHSTTGS